MTDVSSFGRRAAALLAAQSEHVPEVVDVTVLGERLELELVPLHGPTLEQLLAARGRLGPGEAVTVVVSVVRAVAALHRAGFCGAAVSAEAIGFGRDGRPMLQGAGAIEESVHAGADHVAADWRAVSVLADRLGLATHGRAAQTRGIAPLGAAQLGFGLALANVTAAETEQSLDRLEEALFDISEPEPVRLEGPPAPATRQAAPPLSLSPRKRSAAHRRPSGSVVIEALEAGPAALLAGPIAAARTQASTLLDRVHGRARMLIIAAGLAAALVVLAVALVPGSRPDHRVARAASATPSGSPNAAVVSGSGTDPASGSASAADAALRGADPIAAASALLARRDGCLALDGERKAACLAEIADGAASALDRPARPLATLAPSLLERTGDSALVALTPADPKTAPASALLMRTEAGWRLRQLSEN